MIDWIKQHKPLFRKRLANGFDIYVSVNIHESGKITVIVNCDVSIGNFKGLRTDLHKLTDTLDHISNMVKIQKRV